MQSLAPSIAARRRFTADEVAKLVEIGVLREDDPIELIAGDLVIVSPQGPVHSTAMVVLLERLRQVYGHVRMQLPLATDEYGLPEPDLAVVRGNLTDYRQQHPRGPDTLLVVEVAVTSQALDHAKAAVYATAGVPVYWLLDVAARRLEEHRHPGDGGYGVVTILAATEEVALPDCDVRWRVAELLP